MSVVAWSCEHFVRDCASSCISLRFCSLTHSITCKTHTPHEKFIQESIVEEGRRITIVHCLELA